MGIGSFVGGLVDAADNAGAQVFGGLGWDGAADDRRNEQIADANKAAKELSQGLQGGGSGYDAPAITQCPNWSGISHSEIYKTNQESIDQAQVQEAADAWISFAKTLRERGTNYGSDIANIVRGGWQGEAADSAAEVGKPASEWMKSSADAFEATGNNLKVAGDSAGYVKDHVTEPQGFSWGETAASAVPFGLAGGGINALSQMEEQQEAEKAAQETMGRVYSPTLTQVDAKMPQYTAPDGSTANPPPVAPPGGTDWGGGMGDGGNVPGGSGAGSGAGGGGIGGSGSGSGVGGGGIPGGGYSGGAYPGATNPAGTGTAWANPPGGGGIPGGGMPGGPGAGGAGGGAGGMGLAAGMGMGAGGAAGAGAGGRAGGLGAGAKGAGMGAGGRAGAGGLGGAGAGAGGARAAGRGAAGRGGVGGMGGAGRKGEGSEDDEHERPSWLEEQDDVWMNDMPKTAPPVLGE